mmetsp:Transcript_27052/g.58910  ORF Transcript_27052/g.58910 Transcript_27052/m.58910 type:complete len:210 (-) Transcript_27052:47-676(-)
MTGAASPDRPVHWSAILSVNTDASPTEIRAAYRRKVLTVHPDKGGNAEEFQSLKIAYEKAILHASSPLKTAAPTKIEGSTAPSAGGLSSSVLFEQMAASKKAPATATRTANGASANRHVLQQTMKPEKPKGPPLPKFDSVEKEVLYWLRTPPKAGPGRARTALSIPIPQLWSSYQKLSAAQRKISVERMDLKTRLALKEFLLAKVRARI